MDFEIGDRYRKRAPSPTLHINERVAALWAAGETVYHLGFGESRFPVHPRLKSALAEAAGEKRYLPARGLPALRTAVAGYYARELGQPVSAEQVIVGPGSKALIFALQMALKTDLYLPAASWVSYAPQAEMLGRTVHVIPGRMADDYRLDLAALEQMLADSTAQKLLIINSPSNPTGSVLGAGDLKALTAICREHNVVVLSDEIYARLSHDEPAESLARYYPEGTFILGGLSKHLSLGGWRLGVAVAPATKGGERVLAAMEAIASEIWSTASAPVQRAAVLAFSGDQDIEAYIDTCRRIHALRTSFFADRLEALGIRCTRPQGGFYVTASFDRFSGALGGRGIRTSDALARHLLEAHHIATLPGSAFGIPEAEPSLRLATSYLDMETDEAAERILEAFAAGTSAEAFLSEEIHPHTHGCLRAFERFLAELPIAAG